jgi:hypothetical protein
VTYTTVRRGAWFGFDAIELDGLPDDFLLVPLAGNTADHCAVAVRAPATGGCCTPGTPTTTMARSTPPGAGRSP